jgi:hypothetical protein
MPVAQTGSTGRPENWIGQREILQILQIRKEKEDVANMTKICTAASLVALMAMQGLSRSTAPSPASPSAPVENVAPAPAPSAVPAPVVTPDAAIPDKTADKGSAKAAGLGSEVAASDLLNQKVKNSANETVGDINDLSIGSDGKIAAVIIGLGGFLGMGEKNVSLPYDQLNVSRDANGYLVVTVNATKDSLQAAPEWKKPARL